MIYGRDSFDARPDGCSRDRRVALGVANGATALHLLASLSSILRMEIRRQPITSIIVMFGSLRATKGLRVSSSSQEGLSHHYRYLSQTISRVASLAANLDLASKHQWWLLEIEPLIRASCHRPCLNGTRLDNKSSLTRRALRMWATILHSRTAVAGGTFD